MKLTVNKIANMRDSFFDPIQQFFDKTFDEAIEKLYTDSTKSILCNKTSFPKIDSYCLDNKFVIECAIPGIDPDKIDIEMFNEDSVKCGQKYVKISGTIENKEKNVSYYVKELKRSYFERCITVPDETFGEPKAESKNGILKIEWELKEKENKVNKKKIAITKLD